MGIPIIGEEMLGWEGGRGTARDHKLVGRKSDDNGTIVLSP